MIAASTGVNPARSSHYPAREDLAVCVPRSSVGNHTLLNDVGEVLRLIKRNADNIRCCSTTLIRKGDTRPKFRRPVVRFVLPC